MSSYTNYQGDFFRKARSSNPSIQPKQMSQKTRNEEWENNIIDWVTIYIGLLSTIFK